MIATLRPNDWNWLLLFHLLFAFTLVGGLIVVVTTSWAANRRSLHEHVSLLWAIAFRANLFLVLPGFVGAHVFGDLLAGREYRYGDPGWLSAGFAITDVSLIVGGVGLTLLQFWVLRRVRSGRPGGRPATLATLVPPLVLGAMVAVIVLMAGKPVR